MDVFRLGTPAYRAHVATLESLQDELWVVARDAVAADPAGTAPKLYIEVLNDMFDTHTDRVAPLGNRVPTPAMILLVLASGFALATLAMFLTLLGRGAVTSLLTAVVVLVILFVSFDLDRPHRDSSVSPTHPWRTSAGRWTADISPVEAPASRG